MKRFKFRPIYPVLLLLALIVVAAARECNSGTPATPQPSCIDKPEVAVDYGPPAVQSETSNIYIDLSRDYLETRIREIVESGNPPASTEPTAGVWVGDVNLWQEGEGPDRINLISVGIEPWLRAPVTPDLPTPAPVSLNNHYRLKLRVMPHLISPQTVPDPTKRNQLLRCNNDPKCGESGVLLSFNFLELYSVTRDYTVECTDPNYNLLDEQVLKAMYTAFYGDATANPPKTPLAPFPLPAQPVIDLVSGLVGAPVELRGVALGSQGGLLRIGLLMDEDSAFPFQSEAWMDPRHDWAVKIDTDFVGTAVFSGVQQVVAEEYPQISLNSADVFFLGEPSVFAAQLILVKAKGNYVEGPCGDPEFELDQWVEAEVCTHAGSLKSVLRFRDAGHEYKLGGTWVQKGCVGLDYVAGVALDMWQGKDSSSEDPANGTQLEFQVGDKDILYATNVSTNGQFYISGPSTMVTAKEEVEPGLVLCKNTFGEITEPELPPIQACLKACSLQLKGCMEDVASGPGEEGHTTAGQCVAESKVCQTRCKEK